MNDYWFTLESYVFINVAANKALLYNTLDGVVIESDKVKVVELLRELLQKENCGVVLLSHERFMQKEIQSFIAEVRDKYMGDIIDVKLSKGKPVQILPYFNYPHKYELYKLHSITPYKNVLENLSEIFLYVNDMCEPSKLITFLQSLPPTLTLNIMGDIENFPDNKALFSFLDQYPAPKKISCLYTNIMPVQPLFNNNFSYKILIQFPVNMQQWNSSRRILLEQTLPFEYIFNITSFEDFQQTKHLVEQFQIERYQLNPIYTGKNISFFEKYVFLTKEDILSTSMSIKDFFANQSINIYDFGKITIMPNGDAYANVNYPSLGNIYSNNIYEIVQKELNDGVSWFRIRNQSPCNECVYQWLCPPPSNYEIVINRSNLCHIEC